MKLYGSITSPYVRRIRLFLADKNYEFINLDIFSPEGEAVLNKYNPTRKIPMLIDNEQVIYDSGVIFRYLQEKFEQPKLRWQQENLLTLIDAANDSMVELFLCFRSALDTSEDRLFFNLQHQRIDKVLTELNREVGEGSFDSWDYLAMSLYCLVDWAMFRERVDLLPFSQLLAFHEQHKQKQIIIETNPRG